MEKKMNYYLIDFENVKTEGIKELSSLKEGDSLIIFYSEQCKNISLDIINDISKLNIKYSSFKAKVGTKNALDFQLASHLGYLVGNNNDSNSKYFIVSKDKGFDCLCDYWKELGTNVERIPSLAENINSIKEKAKKKTNKVKSSDFVSLDELNELLLPDDMPDDVLKIFNQYKTKLSINNALVKLYKDTKRASSIYKKLKPLLKKKNKT